jgi:hypothetical protein
MAETASGPAPAGASLFERLFSADTLPPPEEERSSTELDKVGDLVTRGEYHAAGQAAEKLLREGLRDVRLVGPLLFGNFLDQGLTSIPNLFSSIHELLTKRWSAFGPRAKKELLADNSLRWLFKLLNKHLEGHERLKDAVWMGWCEPHHREPLLQALALSEPLLVALASTLPKGASVPPFRQLVSWLQTFVQALAPTPPALESEPTPLPQPEALPARPAPVEAVEEPPILSPQLPQAMPPKDSMPMLPISPALELLMRKLQGFNTLVDGGDFLKASVVASDVLALLERFDPRVYLPALLTPFFTRLSTHAQEMEHLMRDTESLSFRALHQLYQVDLNAFLAPGLSVSKPSEE